MSLAIIRWLFFIVIGLPIQFLVYFIYPLVYLFWRIFIYKKPDGDKTIAQHEYLGADFPTRANGHLLDNPDDHGAFSMYGFLDTIGLIFLLDDDYNFIRRWANNDSEYNRQYVSGDVVVSWCFAFTALDVKSQPVAHLLAAAKNYLKYLGTRSWDEFGQGYVSARCNNFGINYCNDSDVLKLGQPAGGPQFYTNSALLALASQRSLFFKFVFWAHWILMGGWYWCWFPVIYSKDTPMYYVRDITMKALYVHKYVFGNRWWITKPMETITYDMSDIRNDLWYAMMGAEPVNPIPKAMDSFFSQKADCTSRPSDRVNPVYGSAILSLAEQAKRINQK